MDIQIANRLFGKTGFAAICGTLSILATAGCGTPQPQPPTGRTAEMDRLDRLIEQNGQALDIISRMMVEKKAIHDPQATPPATGVPPTAANTRPKKVQPMEGRLRSIGSDTMDNLMEYWKAGFNKSQPRIAFYHQGRGSSTAIPALMEAKAELGPMSRKIKSKEAKAFKSKFGYEPIQLRVAVDAVAVYVHPDNPLAKQGMTFKQLDAVFSKTRLLGGKEAATWGDLGLTGEWANAPINVYGRNSASGTHSYFRSTVLTKKGEYTDRCKTLPGSGELVKAISADRYGIGYSGIGYRTDDVAVVPLSIENPNEVFPPEMQYAYSSEYPLSRFLYLAVNSSPSTPLPKLTRSFLEYVFSEEGQRQVMRDGFFPISSKIALEEKAKIGM